MIAAAGKALGHPQRERAPAAAELEDALAIGEPARSQVEREHRRLPRPPSVVDAVGPAARRCIAGAVRARCSKNAGRHLVVLLVGRAGVDGDRRSRAASRSMPRCAASPSAASLRVLGRAVAARARGGCRARITTSGRRSASSSDDRAMTCASRSSRNHGTNALVRPLIVAIVVAAAAQRPALRRPECRSPGAGTRASAADRRHRRQPQGDRQREEREADPDHPLEEIVRVAASSATGRHCRRGRGWPGRP